MKSRKETVDFICSQMHGENGGDAKKSDRWHYGYGELRDLLDFIYESEPNEDEILLIPKKP